jgi:hypothetical protein
LATAYRVRLAKLAAEDETEESAEAEAGAILDAETAVEIRGVHRMIESYIDTLNKAAG